MKRIVCFLILLLLQTSVYATATTSTVSEDVKNTVDNLRNSPMILITNQNTWQVLDVTTDAGSEPNDLTAAAGYGGYGGRTYLAVIGDANTGAAEVNAVIIPGTWNSARFRLVGAADAGTVTYQVYGGTLPMGSGGTVNTTTANCALAYYGQLAFTVGTQLSDIAGYYFADQVTITTTNQDHPTTWSFNSTEDDRVAECRIDLLGDNLLVLVPTTCTTNCKLLGKGY
jgi:hypothetical protein